MTNQAMLVRAEQGGVLFDEFKEAGIVKIKDRTILNQIRRS